MEKTMEKIAELEGLGVKPEQPAESEEVSLGRDYRDRTSAFLSDEAT